MTLHQPATTLRAEPVVVSSAWPWRGSEKRMIVATTLIGLAVAAYGGGWWWTAAAVGLGGSSWLYLVGRSRKELSRVTATVTTDRLAVASRGAVGDSAVRIGEVTRIGYRRLQSDHVLLLHGGGTAARVPQRLLEHVEVREVVERVLAGAPQVATEASAVLADHDLA